MYENSPVMQRELYKGACAPQASFSTGMPKICISVGAVNFCTCSGSTYIKIGTIQRRLAWPLRKDDTQIREAFQIFDLSLVQSSSIVKALFRNNELTQVPDVYYATWVFILSITYALPHPIKTTKSEQRQDAVVTKTTLGGSW